MLIAPKSVRLEDLQASLARHWIVESAGLDRLVIQEEGSRVYIEEDPNYTNALEKESHPHLQRLKELISTNPNTTAYFFDYSDIELVKKALLICANDHRIIVDNDFGTILRGPEFIQKIRSNPSWDWREDAKRSDQTRG